MEIIIGRKKETNQLKITVGKQEKICGAENSVPDSVSRTHCSLVTGNGGAITVKNLNPANETFVNGVSYDSCPITQDDKLELGADHYVFNWSYVSELFPVTVDISPLRNVWEKYHNTRLQTSIKERRFNAIRSLSGVFSMIAMVLTLMNGNSGDDSNGVRLIIYSVSFVFLVAVFIYSFIGASKLPKENDKLEKEFRANYICPNKKCHHFMGNQPYDVLSQGNNCPYCKAQYAKK